MFLSETPYILYSSKIHLWCITIQHWWIFSTTVLYNCFIQLFYTIKTYQHCKWVSRITNAREVWKRNASSFRKELPILSVDSWREEVVIWEENSSPGRTWNEKTAETAILAVEISSTIISLWTERNLTESKKTGRFRQMIMPGIPYYFVLHRYRFLENRIVIHAKKPESSIRCSGLLTVQNWKISLLPFTCKCRSKKSWFQIFNQLFFR